jgi:hypothetical protein
MAFSVGHVDCLPKSALEGACRPRFVEDVGVLVPNLISTSLEPIRTLKLRTHSWLNEVVNVLGINPNHGLDKFTEFLQLVRLEVAKHVIPDDGGGIKMLSGVRGNLRDVVEEDVITRLLSTQRALAHGEHLVATDVHVLWFQNLPNKLNV